MLRNMNRDFDVIYASIGKSPKNIYFSSDKKLLRFLLDNLNKIDFISINDRHINKIELINKNIIMSRYFKLISIK